MSKKRAIVYGILLAVALLLILCGIGVLWARQDRTEDPTPESHHVDFVVGEWQGRLAVFEDGQDRPVRWFEDVWVASFPETEQRRLAAGIRVATDRELAAVLEDYTA